MPPQDPEHRIRDLTRLIEALGSIDGKARIDTDEFEDLRQHGVRSLAEILVKMDLHLLARKRSQPTLQKCSIEEVSGVAPGEPTFGDSARTQKL